MTYSWEEEPVFCFTSDIDWSSESIIKYSHDILSGDDLKLTYFITHSSPFLNELNASNKIDLLIHPNFLPNSSHGDSFKEVIDYCMNLVPNADGFRSHRYFEGCLPIEILAERGREALAYGPMRPVGIICPYDGNRPYAVVQLRRDNLAGTLLNIVGFQTNLKWPEQKNVLRMIPGLGQARFARYGMMHRNTFINAPKALHETLQSRARSDLFFAGQITGVEGYAGNVATGLLAGINITRHINGQIPLVVTRTSMIGALCHYVANADSDTFQPMKANFG